MEQEIACLLSVLVSVICEVFILLIGVALTFFAKENLKKLQKIWMRYF